MNQGLTDAQIAKRLNLTRASAAASVGRIRIAFGGGTRYDAVARARALGIISPPKDGGRPAALPEAPGTPILGPDELQLLDLMSRGLSNIEIAKKLRVTRTAVHSRVHKVKGRIGGATRFEVVTRAREMKLVQTPKEGGLHAIMLTPFRRRVLELAAQHLTNTQIGRRLRRTTDAVTEAQKYTRKMLGVRTTTEAIDRAVELGLLTIPKQKDAPNPFSKREHDIIEGLFADLTHQEIADAHGLKIGSVGTRIQHMKSKLRVTTTDELLDEVKRLRLYVPRQPRKRLVSRDTLLRRNTVSQGIQGLTERQIDVIEACARHPKGLNAEMAADLGISKHTLEGHLLKIRQRLGVYKTRDIPEEALNRGIIRRRDGAATTD
jgi:DNA-binding NarL/FixJ family response regulator